MPREGVTYADRHSRDETVRGLKRQPGHWPGGSRGWGGGWAAKTSIDLRNASLDNPLIFGKLSGSNFPWAFWLLAWGG